MTEATSPSAPNGSEPVVDPGLAEGRSQLLLFGAMGLLAVGVLLSEGVVVWAGVAAIALAFAINTAGKLVHYRSLPIPGADRAKLAASWLLLAATVLALLWTFAYARYGPGDGAFLLSLGVGGLGFALLHMATQSKYLPAEEVDGDA